MADVCRSAVGRHGASACLACDAIDVPIQAGNWDMCVVPEKPCFMALGQPAYASLQGGGCLG